MTLTRKELQEIVVEYLKDQFDEMGYQSWRFVWQVVDEGNQIRIYVRRSGVNIFSANVTDDGQMTLSGGVNDYIHDPNARRLRETIKRHVGRVLSMNPNLGRGSS